MNTVRVLNSPKRQFLRGFKIEKKAVLSRPNGTHGRWGYDVFYNGKFVKEIAKLQEMKGLIERRWMEEKSLAKFNSPVDRK